MDQSIIDLLFNTATAKCLLKKIAPVPLVLIRPWRPDVGSLLRHFGSALNRKHIITLIWWNVDGRKSN